MSMLDHKEEVRRLLDRPNGTKVWRRFVNVDVDADWLLLNHHPTWHDDLIYIVDDKHAEIRKEWIDKGKPQMQYKAFGDWTDVEDGDDTWSIHVDYRFKQNGGDTPEGEDPIKYHAQRLGDKGGDWYLAIGLDGEQYGKGTHDGYRPYNVILMESGTVNEIIKALYSGELKL